MGSIHFQAASMFGSLSDLIGTKAGLALTDQELRKLLARDDNGRFERYVTLGDDDHVRIHSATFEEMFEFLLYTVGRLEHANNLPPMASLYHKYKQDPDALELVYKLFDQFINFLEGISPDPKTKAIDPSPFIRSAAEVHRQLGLEIAYDIVTSFAVQLEINSIYFPTESAWTDVAELAELFRSEGLETQYGRFFDQRYIDYLHRNFDDIDRVNWRKFEGLTGEFFDRQGFRVEMGPGRNDDGVDVRVWSADEAADSPPAIIVQCKRQKENVSKVIVKALYADVIDARASSGLIVTTSRLAPGSRDVCAVRNYPIEEADRETLRQWVENMRKPGLGMVT